MVEKTKTQNEFYEDLAFQESSGRWNVVNYAGYLGAFQMGEEALAEAGYYKRNPIHPKNDGINRWDGTWTGKDGVWSKQDYLNNHEAQKSAAKVFHKNIWAYAKNLGLHNHIGETINGVEITPSGIIAGGHSSLQNTNLYIKTNGKTDRADGNGTKVSKYIQKFGGYDTYDVTKIPTYERYKEEFGIKKPKYTPDKVVKTYNTKVEKEIEDERKYFSNVYKEYKQHVKDVIKYGDRVNKERKAFLEGFDSGSIKPSKASSKKSPKTKTGSMTLGDGKWITTKQGNHVFIED